MSSNMASGMVSEAPSSVTSGEVQTTPNALGLWYDIIKIPYIYKIKKFAQNLSKKKKKNCTKDNESW